MDNTKYFQVKLKNSSSLKLKMINGIGITKNWQIRSGDKNEFDVFKDIETQELVKENGKFVPVATPAEKPSPSVNVTKDTPSIKNVTETVNTTEFLPAEVTWTEEQLKEYLIGKGVDKKALKAMSYQELFDQVQFIESQSQ